ncbi:MAG: hypothetical protein GX620_07630 [Chloroflexi bacterium]|nr:hypothetical protein [Chloroflexota bacterium]
MDIKEQMVRAIASERRQRELEAAEDVVALVRQGNVSRAVENLIYFEAPGRFGERLGAILSEIGAAELPGADACTARAVLRFLCELNISLVSYLPSWNLRDSARHGAQALSGQQVEEASVRVRDAVIELARRSPEPMGELLDEWRAYHEARLGAEEANDPAGAAQQLIGVSVGEYLANLQTEIDGSNLKRIAELRQKGQTLTEISNDFAAFLEHALYLGASFATTNPPLVEMAWRSDPARWDPVVDRIVTENPEAGLDLLGRLVTLEVVLANMTLLRPIFLLTEGQMGCVCLQVNPVNHGDQDAMIGDALFLYERFQARLGGGIPNVVFKLPGTQAGLAACRELTKRGIGVTITVNFGMFQHVAFAEAIRDGAAAFSCLVEMNGRLAYPVRDELLSKIDVLAAQGITEGQAREAAAWAGVAVTKRMYSYLRSHGYDLGACKPLVASLRIYEGNGYDGLPSAFPDITEILGASILSVFPNIRRPFDEMAQVDLHPMSVESPVPEHVMRVLAHSEIFRQAYFAGDHLDVEGDERYRPAYALDLADEDAVFKWAPVHATLTQFIGSYETFIERIREHQLMVQ